MGAMTRLQVLSIIAAVLAVGALQTGPAIGAPRAAAFRVPASQRQLFLDDDDIARMKNLKRTLHRPDKKGAVIEPLPGDPQVNCLQIRCTAAWNPHRKVWQLWDCMTPNDLHAQFKYCGAYFESKDGLHWTRPNVGMMQYRGSKDNNYVFIRTGSGYTRPDMAIYDPSESDPAKRYKVALPNSGAAVSPDGIHWKMLEGASVIPSGDEYNFSHDRQEDLFILTVKGGGPHGRSVYLSTSKDFKTWTKARLVFHADDNDQVLGREHIKAHLADPTLQQPFWNDPKVYNVDVYNMAIFRYESRYIGMPMLYHAVGPIPDHPNTVGFHLIQLIGSKDLKSWRRLVKRETFIGPSPKGPGVYDTLQICPPSDAVVRGDELWFYYTGLKYRGTYGLPAAEQKKLDELYGAICLAVLRRDGFVSLDAGTKEGKIQTKLFTATGGELFVNVDAPKGEIRVEVLDGRRKVLAESAPLSGDLTHGQVKWRTGNISRLRGKDIALRFKLRNADFYSYWLAKE